MTGDADEPDKGRSGRRALDAMKPGLPDHDLQPLVREVLRRLDASPSGTITAPDEEITALCRALCAPHPYSAAAFIDGLLRAGVSEHRVYEQYLTRAARELGRQWQADLLKFTQVTVACSRIYNLIDRLRRDAPFAPITNDRKLAFAAVPGEEHTLGVEMASDLFRRNGWEVLRLVGMPHDALLDALGDVSIVMVGLSASGMRARKALLRLVVALRVTRPDLKIMVSGQIAKDHPEFLQMIGADSAATSIEQALHDAQRLVNGDV